MKHLKSNGLSSACELFCFFRIIIITNRILLVNRVVKSCKKRLFLGVKWGVDPIFSPFFAFFENASREINKKSACFRQTEFLKN